MSEPAILYNNIIAAGVTATDTATGFYVDNLHGLRNYTFWRAASSGTKYITMDAGAAVDVDSLAIFGHNFATSAATISLESSTTGAWAGEEVEQIAGFTVANIGPIFKRFTLATIRYWRVKIVTASVAAQASVMMIGAALDFPDYPDTPFAPQTETINATAEISKAGYLLGVVSQYTPVDISATFTYLPLSFVDGDYLTFWENHGRQKKPFFWAHDLGTYPNRVHFAKFSDTHTHEYPQGDITNADTLDLKMEAIGEVVSIDTITPVLVFSAENDEVIAPGASSQITVNGGAGDGAGGAGDTGGAGGEVGGSTFTWTLTGGGGGASLASSTTSTGSNTLITTGGFCGSAVITVSQNGASASTAIRSTTGQWTLYGTGQSVEGLVTGDYDSYSIQSGAYYFTKTFRQYRLIEVITIYTSNRDYCSINEGSYTLTSDIAPRDCAFYGLVVHPQSACECEYGEFFPTLARNIARATTTALYEWTC